MIFLLLQTLDVSGGQPCAARGADGRTYVSWIEDGSKLRYAVLAERWSEPKTIAEGKNWFVNWADCPQIAALEDGTLAAAWLEKLGAGTYAYGVRMSVAGKTFWLHDDTSETEHGFVSLVPDGDRFHAVWLDGRAGPMSVRTRTISRDGTLGKEEVRDESACECCPTSAAMVGGKLVAVWRDLADGIRDIRMGAKLVHEDGWKVPG
jgi:hypothetical protein